MKRLANFRLEESVLYGLDKAAQAAGISKTAWVDRVLRAELGLEPGEQAAKPRAKNPQGGVEADSEPDSGPARAEWIARREAELRNRIPSSAARRSAAVRDWEARAE